jgi:2-polyprenyl-6-methoxyphenol hydroxylase-like FAD-dependent oxidoreductase
LTLANLLRRAGIGCVLLEQESRAFIEQRPRAGFIEEWAVRGLERRGLGEQLAARPDVGLPAATFRTAEGEHRIDCDFVAGREPMAHGRLYLAGESAHLVAPIAAKGMNLALRDAFLLAEAHYAGDPSRLAGYSAACLPLVWQYQEFSLWLSEIFHHSAAAAFAELYIGKNADF